MYRKLPVAELRRAADEDFALALTDEEKTNKESIIAAFTEAGLTFESYLSANPHLREKYAPEPVVVEPLVVEQEVVVQPVIRTAEPVAVEDVFLVKKTRENPLYEIAGGVTRKVYRWTNDHPYALVEGADLDSVLDEDGFRQARPSELSEYYS